MDLDVAVLYFEGCPSWRTVLERMNEAAEQSRIPVRVRARLVETIEDAETVRVSGVADDPHRWT